MPRIPPLFINVRLLVADLQWGIDMENRPRLGLAQEYIGLKLVILLLPVSLLLFYWHQHRSIALALGLSLGIGLSQVVPPRKPAWQILLWIMGAVLLGLATAIFPHWNW
jgi:hypothetical protein